MAVKQLQIEGMTCTGCEKTIAEALTGAGAEKVEANWRAGRATFEVAHTTDEELKAAVVQAGYRVVSIEGVEGAGPETRGFKPLLSDKSHDYDLVVLGSGSAAFAAAITATEAGGTVALME